MLTGRTNRASGLSTVFRLPIWTSFILSDDRNHILQSDSMQPPMPQKNRRHPSFDSPAKDAVHYRPTHKRQGRKGVKIGQDRRFLASIQIAALHKMSLIHLSNITLVRQGQRILADITWHVKKGQHWALLGANGSGKTTLLKVITGYEWPTTGSVTVLRQSFGKCNLPEFRKQVGWASSAIESRLPVYERAIDIVASGFFASIGLYRQPSEAEWLTATEIIRHVGGDQIMHRPFGLLSQGEQRRIVIARALVNRPQLLLLDEPCAGLDPAARESLLADLERLARSPHAPTIIMVTHHVEEIGPWIGHVLVLKNGTVLKAGPKNETLTTPVLSEALGCLCEVEKLGDRYRLTLIGGQSCSPT